MLEYENRDPGTVDGGAARAFLATSPRPVIGVTVSLRSASQVSKSDSTSFVSLIPAKWDPSMAMVAR